MKSQLLWFLINAALKYLTAERMKKWIAFGVMEIRASIVEDGITDWKDKVVLPMLDNVVTAFDLEEEE